MAPLPARGQWPKLDSADRLRHNDVPVVATIYVNDLYVERDFAMETGPRPWITNEYEHNGQRANRERVLGRSSPWSSAARHDRYVGQPPARRLALRGLPGAEPVLSVEVSAPDLQGGRPSFRRATRPRR